MDDLLLNMRFFYDLFHYITHYDLFHYILLQF